MNEWTLFCSDLILIEQNWETLILVGNIHPFNCEYSGKDWQTLTTTNNNENKKKRANVAVSWLRTKDWKWKPRGNEYMMVE
ncbi:hypothetical protein BLOT_005969 [Blomia tropicalis]|nr:hypothetical protein BLOT_005969 [Blomia tropicalis]